MAALRATAVGMVGAVLLAGAAAPAEAQTRRALIVGVSDYSHWTMSNLNFCDDDANDMRDMLALDPLWNPGNITVLVDFQATRAAIQSWMSYYASVTESGDTFLFFFSGHGAYYLDVGPLEDDEDDGMDEYLCPHDTDGFDYDTMISDDELAIWLWDIKAAKRIVIIDSCFAGGMTKDVSGGKKGTPIAIKTANLWNPTPPMAGDGFAEDLVRPQKPPAPGDEESKDIDDAYLNTYVIMSCDDIEVSSEDFFLGHGLLTYYVLEAGYSTYTDINDDAVLSAEEIFAYLEPWVASYWDGYGIGQTRQNPQAFDTNLGAEINFMTAQVPRPIVVIMKDDLDEDPEWEIMPPDAVPTWEFGEPLGVGGQSGDPDPLTPYSWDPLAEEPSIYGFNLAGDYFNSMAETTLTMPPFDLTGLWRARLRFWRWLGVEEIYWDEAAIQVSIDDGANWVDVWRNPGLSISDTQWMYCDYPLGSLTDFQSEVLVRWVMGPTDYSLTFCGWNIDDVEIVATPARTLVLYDGTNTTTVTYDLGELATIIALPQIGWTLDEWVGDIQWVGDVFSMTTTVLMNGNYSIQARLRNWFYLTVNNGSSPPGITPPAGTTIPGGNTQAYMYGDIVPIASAAPPGQFTQWTGDITTVTDPLSPVTDIVMNADYIVTAEQTYSLSVINGTGDGLYNLNDVVPIVSTLPPGTFDQWIGDIATVANPFSASTTILMDADHTVTAQGTTQYTLTVNNGTGGGTYADGTTANINSTLPAGTFDYWAGDVGTVADIYDPSTTIVMTGNYSVTAVAVALVPPDVDAATEDNLDWVYQNTPLTLSKNGHKVRLQVNVLDLGSNTAVTVTVAKAPGSGLGEVTIENDPGGDPLVKYIVGSLRTDGLADCGDLTLEVTATGDVSGQDTVTLPFRVNPLGDIDGNGAPEPGDASFLVLKLNGTPPAGYHDNAFDLDANGGAEPADVMILMNILNGLPVP